MLEQKLNNSLFDNIYLTHDSKIEIFAEYYFKLNLNRICSKKGDKNQRLNEKFN